MPYWPPEKIREEQSRALRRLIQHAWTHVPFYRQWLRDAGALPGDIRTVDDLRKLPILGKHELEDRWQELTDPGAWTRDGLTISSSGTTGRPHRYRYDAQALFDALAAGRRQRLVLQHFVKREAGYREAVIHRAGSVSWQLRAFWEQRLIVPRQVELQRLLLTPDRPFPELLEQLNQFQPAVIRGYGSHLGALLRWIYEQDLPFHKPATVVYGADTMSPADRQLIEQEMGIPVLSTYQAGEALRIGFECEFRNGFHLCLDQVDVRVVDGHGRDVEPGQTGEIVISNLTNRATVILNYRLGDMGVLAQQPCPCGRTLPLLQSLAGRAEDLILRPDGSVVHALSLLSALQAVPGVQQVQIVQEELERFRLRIVKRHGMDLDELALRRCVWELAGPAAEVVIECVAQLEPGPSGKVQAVISHLRR